MNFPFGKGRAHVTSGPLAYVIGDWSLGSVVTFQSGPGYTVTTQTNNTNAFSAGGQRADVSRDPSLSGDQRSLGRWFDTSAFQQPALYKFGNQGVNILRAPGLSNFDFSVLRNFALREAMRLQFRAELFNALNHANFGTPGRVFGGAGFGVISSAFPARRIQLGLRLSF